MTQGALDGAIMGGVEGAMTRAKEGAMTGTMAIAAHLFSVPAYEQEAQAVLPPAIWAYLSGGAMSETTLGANRESWERLQLVPRRLQALTGGHTRLELWGKTYEHPIWLAPVAHQQLFHAEAELASAQGAGSTHTPMLVSSFANRRLEDIAAHSSAPLWFQLYWQGSRAASLALIRRAESAGYQAIVLTVDAPHMGIRDRERASGFQLPADCVAVNLASSPIRPVPEPGRHPLFDGLFALAPVWEDVVWLKSQTSLPLVLKGILHPADAQQAVQLGVDGLIVSNHGGRVLDGCITPMDALPALRAVTPELYPLFLDSGIRRGNDVVKALALGATAVMVGRPYVYGLAVAGALGVAHVVQLLREELEVTMGQCGCASLQAVRQLTVLD